MANKQGCSNVKIDEEVSFSVVVKVEECKPEEADNSYSFNIEVTDFFVSTLPRASQHPRARLNTPARVSTPPRAGLAFFIEIFAPLRPRSLIWCVATSSL